MDSGINNQDLSKNLPSDVNVPLSVPDQAQRPVTQSQQRQKEVKKQEEGIFVQGESKTTLLELNSAPLSMANLSSPWSQRPNQQTLKEMLNQLDASEVVACKDMLVNLLSELGVETKGITLTEAMDMRNHLQKQFSMQMYEFKHIEQIAYQMPEISLQKLPEPSTDNNQQEAELVCSEKMPDILIKFQEQRLKAR